MQAPHVNFIAGQQALLSTNRAKSTGKLLILEKHARIDRQSVSPLTHLQRVIDVGTGTGIWAM
jgi:ubiquinone/menaquinone biosynthesis C-methylase UbiE